MNTSPLNSVHSDFDSALWQRLCDYSFDSADAAMSLRDRLSRDNDWSSSYADVVLDEYRRFVYLAVMAGHPVTPSEDVDQAWHLHLLYTRDYWEYFCPDVLGRPLHHGPTLGGEVENTKFADWYSKTLESYRGIFNSEPPAAVWPSVRRRFKRASLYRRVNIGTHLVLSRRRLRSGLNVGALLGVGFFATQLALADEQAVVSPGMLALRLLAFGAILAIVIAWIVFDQRRRRKRDLRIKRDGGRVSQSIVIGGCGTSANPPGSSKSGTSTDSGADGGGGCGG